MRGHEHSVNELSGTVHGFVVQASSVHGGIHVSGPAAREEMPPPWQLPPAVRITDRTEALRALEVHRNRATEEGHPTLAAVSGLGGVGKTAVALAWLPPCARTFPAVSCTPIWARRRRRARPIPARWWRGSCGRWASRPVRCRRRWVNGSRSTGR